MTKLSIIIFLFIQSTFGAFSHQLKKGKLAYNTGELIEVYLAITPKEQNEGLSGWKKTMLNDYQGMLFLYHSAGPRSFWMPNTFFNLDIIYLNKDLKIIHIAKNVPHHPGHSEPPPIPRVKEVFSHHVLELKSSSAFAKKLKKGEQFIWMGKKSIKEILRDTHP